LNARRVFGTTGWLVTSVLLIGIPSPGAAGDGNRLADIQARGTLNCGVWPYVPGFAIERDGRYVGFDIDVCRAVAAAILGDPAKVRFVTLADVKQFTERNDIDLAIRRLTWTLRRETATGMTFGPITFYDGQGFLVAKYSGIKSVSQLTGERVCVINMDRHPETLYNHFRAHNRDIQVILVDGDKEAEEAIRGNRCRAYSADVSWLAAARSNFVDGLTRYEILSEQVSKEPLAPLMRAKDTGLVEVVRWTVYAMIEAEELGLNSYNIDIVDSSSPWVRSFLSIHPDSRVALSAGKWVRAIIVGVGNYGEVFDRNLGAGSPIKLDRGLNRLWSQGGLMYAPPLDR
jgi:general L-amino acid transport system substrate-binding protein